MNGLILAGGNSSRMGVDKAMIDYHGTSQYLHLYNLLLPYCERVYISSREDSYSILPMLFDDVQYDGVGPMAGLLTAFDFEDTDWLVVAVDYPYFSAIEIKQLIASNHSLASVFFNPETNLYEPFLGLYRKFFKSLLLRYFNEKEHSLQTILQKNDIEKMIPKELKTIKSVDTNEEYEMIRALIEEAKNLSVRKVQIHKSKAKRTTAEVDFLAIEEPLEISLSYYKNEMPFTQKISITMRTPGHDRELAIGFLLTESILRNRNQIEKIEQLNENQIIVYIHKNEILQLDKLQRNFYTTSSCGVCGKSSLDAVRTVVKGNNKDQNRLFIAKDIILSLKNQMDIYPSNFAKTGGIHASALFDLEGNLISIFEDVGRHNALDKLIGEYVLNGVVDLSSYILLLSGRASFELVQKAASVHIQLICALGAPSSLAVELAEEFGVTLIGFLKQDSFNIYSGEERIG